MYSVIVRYQQYIYICICDEISLEIFNPCENKYNKGVVFVLASVTQIPATCYLASIACKLGRTAC